MQDFTEHLVELIRFTSTDLPGDIETALRKALGKEPSGSAAHGAFSSMIENIEMARAGSTPLCQDTGTPIFYVQYPLGLSTLTLGSQIRRAISEATRLNYLRPNAVDTRTGKNTGDNSGDAYYPTIHFEETEGPDITVDLILKGGGCENVGAQYKLPDKHLEAGRDLEGVRKAVLDAVFQAQGRGCAPGVLGVAVGGDRGTSYLASKEVLLRRLDDENPDRELDALEKRITKEANQLEIGPMGFGGKTSVLGTRICMVHRLPACYFVSVSYMCWSYRRRRMSVTGGTVQFS
jgi:fumarate hydratase class I